MGVRCRYCGVTISMEGSLWVDSTGGDVCSGDDELRNENGAHDAE